MTMKLTAVFEKVPEGYIAFVEELPGANTQGATIEEARSNLQEAVEMILDANRVLAEEALNGRSVIREPFVIVSQCIVALSSVICNSTAESFVTARPTYD